MMRISFSGTGRLDRFAREYAIRARENPKAFARKVQAIVTTAQVGERTAGLDKNGQVMPPRLRPRKDGASGGVLSPHDARSRTIDGFFVKVEFLPGAFRLVAGYSDAFGPFPDRGPGIRTLLYHAQGIRTKRGVVKRDVLGVSPKTRAEIAREFHIGSKR